MNNETVIEKKRHWSLTVFLILVLFINSIEVIRYSAEFCTACVIDCSFNLIAYVAILRWKKWGFWLLAVMSFVTFVFNLYNGADIIIAFSGFMPVAVLYGILHIGGDKMGWKQLD
ncbi:hypothetical protein N9218_00805 [bacterium]|nr:hypothetical protein [bacterium]